MADLLDFDAVRKRQQAAREIGQDDTRVIIDDVPERVFVGRLDLTARAFVAQWKVAIDAVQSNDAADLDAVIDACDRIESDLKAAIDAVRAVSGRPPVRWPLP